MLTLFERGWSAAPGSSRGIGQFPAAVRGGGAPARLAISRCTRWTNQKSQTRPIGRAASAGQTFDDSAMQDSPEKWALPKAAASTPANLGKPKSWLRSPRPPRRAPSALARVGKGLGRRDFGARSALKALVDQPAVQCRTQTPALLTDKEGGRRLKHRRERHHDDDVLQAPQKGRAGGPGGARRVIEERSPRTVGPTVEVNVFVRHLGRVVVSQAPSSITIQNRGEDDRPGGSKERRAGTCGRARKSAPK
eukprot:3128532-Pyramimonas_sp.AAC.2